ncbi:putative regulatory protein, FmdB family [Desulfovibrionales bacterium]
MPIYEYHCKECKKEFEELVFYDTGLIQCPHCKSKQTNKLMSCCCHTSGPSLDADSTPSQFFTGRSHSGCTGCSGGSCSNCG